MALHGKAHEFRKANLRALERFGKGDASIRGRKFASPFPGSALHLGQMTSRDQSPGQQDVQKIKSSMIIYVVYSYSTPIAYITTEGETVIPDIRYSPTTTNHQSVCRVYLNKPE